MTTFTRTWNASYEAVPADGDAISEGALRIRHLKNDIAERLEVDHSWAGDANDGAHNKVTLLEQGSDPSTVANTGYLYTKDVAGATELFFKDAAGNVVQVTSSGASNAFPSGTKVVFYQVNPPTGWTAVALNDRALRVVSGGGSGGSTGGTNAFSTVFAQSATGAHTLVEAELPVMTHGLSAQVWTAIGTSGAAASGGAFALGLETVASHGGGGSHSHTFTMDIQYANVIVGSKT